MKNITLFSILTMCLAIFSCSNDNTNNDDSSCVKPTNFEVLAYDSLSEVEIGWTAGSDETEWEIEYGPAGFDHINGDFTLSSSATIEISNLDSTVAYDFYIRSICDAENYSEWVGPISNIPRH
ncbi:hypothetical protein N7U66_20550 [Lacinutrix neustonica]|uniref:Fibronectin type-III domain-containing protein n=1 Tax=Lacinutrix neustonica TaxID=2980107 RepID=A0A9E8SEB2_9FLAO|nr:hypothetical protein [Lacinutrix neustonica]WAC02134.1 hypothetical protein N7U66_20550 [Lacinutrix neustonica]